jgi:hypothetical protein
MSLGLTPVHRGIVQYDTRRKDHDRRRGRRCRRCKIRVISAGSEGNLWLTEVVGTRGASVDADSGNRVLAVSVRGLTEGEMLHATPGTSMNSRSTCSYQWVRCARDFQCSPIRIRHPRRTRCPRRDVNHLRGRGPDPARERTRVLTDARPRTSRSPKRRTQRPLSLRLRQRAR